KDNLDFSHLFSYFVFCSLGLSPVFSLLPSAFFFIFCIYLLLLFFVLWVCRPYFFASLSLQRCCVVAGIRSAFHCGLLGILKKWKIVHYPRSGNGIADVGKIEDLLMLKEYPMKRDRKEARIVHGMRIKDGKATCLPMSFGGAKFMKVYIEKVEKRWLISSN
ncbi:hypothetical protein QQP08_008320, partial [Theobroma cacao]